MPSRQVNIQNSTDETNMYWFLDDTGNFAWSSNNTTPPPGEGFTSIGPGGFAGQNINAGVISNFYFFIIPPNTVITPYPTMGLSFQRSADDTSVVLDSITPGTVKANSGVGAYFIQQKDLNNYVILDTVTIKIVNNTGAGLPYFINTIQAQPSPASLTDFTYADVTEKPIPAGGAITVNVFNTLGDACGIYFFADGAKSTDIATAVSLVKLSDATITNSNGAATATNDGTTITVTISSSKFPAWGWGLIVAGAILLIIIVVLIIHYFTKSSKKKAEGKEDKYDDYDDDPDIAKHHAEKISSDEAAKTKGTERV